MVKVACHVANGIMVRLYKEGYDDGTGDGVKPMIPDGPGIRLNGPSRSTIGVSDPSGGRHLEAGITDVDEQWMIAWLKQNEKNPFVGEGLIYIVEGEGPNPTR